MVRIIIISLLLLIYLGCQNKCEKDSELKLFFYATIDSLEEYIPSKKLDTLSLSPARSLLLLTGIEPSLEVKLHSDYFDFPYSVIYPKENFERDKKKWDKWYKESNCMNMRQADSIIAANEKLYIEKLKNE